LTIWQQRQTGIVVGALRDVLRKWKIATAIHMTAMAQP
jgi:hypothetical protein